MHHDLRRSATPKLKLSLEVGAALTPFFDEHTRDHAASHLRSGTLLQTRPLVQPALAVVAASGRFKVLHLEPLKRALEIEGRPLSLDRRFERRCFRRQSQTQLEGHLGQTSVRLDHSTEQVLSFIFGYMRWIVVLRHGHQSMGPEGRRWSGF